MSGKDVEREIRKLRKKLRQIEKLELSDAYLNEDEESKIDQKDVIRRELLDLLSELPEYSFDTSLTSLNTTNSDVAAADDSFGSLSRAFEQCTITEVETQHLTSSVSEGDIEKHTVDKADMKRKNDVIETESSSFSSSATCSSTSSAATTPAHTSTPSIQTSAQPSTSAAATPAPASPAKRAKVESTQSTAASKKGQAKKSGSTSGREAGSSWGQGGFRVAYLDGHSDRVLCLATDGSHLVTGSRDTTVRVWNITDGTEERSLGGHSQSVTAVLLLNNTDIGRDLGRTPDNNSIIVSGSNDCNINIWSLQTGEKLKSVYIFNPVTSAAFLPEEQLVLIGTGGGKVELWDLVLGQNVCSVPAHTDAVTAIYLHNNLIYSSSADGQINVFECRERVLRRVFLSENIHTASGALLPWRPIHCCVAAGADCVYFGDDGPNVKALQWRTGLVTKLANHTIEFGSTSALCCHDNLLLAAGYDLDKGLGYVNVRSLPVETYLGTICDEDTSRISCLTAVTNGKQELCVITGGEELKTWTKTKDLQSYQGDDVVCIQHVPAYARRAVHSEAESESELSESDSEAMPVRNRAIKAEDQPASWWCNLM